MELQKISYKYDYNSLGDFFLKKYNLEKLEKDYFKYIDSEYFLSLDKKENAELLKIIWKVDKVMLKAYKMYFEELEENLGRFYPFLRHFRDKYPVEEHFVWRYDILIDEEWTYKFLETNANTPWLITELYNIWKLQKPAWYVNQWANYVKYAQDFFKKYEGKKIWILLPYSFEDEDFLIWMDYFKMLWETMWEENIVVGDIYESNVVGDKDFYIKWEKVDVVLSFFPLEFLLSDLDYAESYFDVMTNGNCILHNPIESIILQDKLLFAIIHENLTRFSKGEQEIIKMHIPFTTREFQEDESKFIVKARFWRISRDVFDEKFYSNIWNDTKEFQFFICRRWVQRVIRKWIGERIDLFRVGDR